MSIEMQNKIRALQAETQSLSVRLEAVIQRIIRLEDQRNAQVSGDDVDAFKVHQGRKRR
jgi:hypothetical protein